MLERLRALMASVLTPPARLLLRWGVSADVITWVGTAAFVVVAMIMIPLGWLVPAAVVLGLIAMTDMLDGQVARLSGRKSSWGAFLDSTLDRVADGAVFVAVAGWFALTGQPGWVIVTGWALVAGQVTSYVKARAESHGWNVTGGIAARADRIVLLLAGVLLQGLGVPYALAVAVALLAVLSTVTVAQRFASVRRQADAEQTP